MDANTEQRILDQYDERAALYDAFRVTLRDVARGIARDLDIRALSVTSRLKEKGSLQDKLRRKGEKYRALEDVTDIAAVRITTYYADEVKDIADRIPTEFDVDWDESTNKGDLLDPDRFGYLSWHHIVRLGPERVSLSEYSQFAGLKAEIQTRSILQHGWASIEHDLGYKSKIEVPTIFQRRFSRLAGLFELADQEFMSIRDDLKAYEKTLPEQIRSVPESVEINKASLTAFLADNETARRLDSAIADAVSNSGLINIEEAIERENWLEGDVGMLHSVGIKTIATLEEELVRHESDILRFAEEWHKDEEPESREQPFIPGVGVFYLAYLRAADTRDIDKVEELLRVGRISTAKVHRQIAENVISACESIGDGSR